MATPHRARTPDATTTLLRAGVLAALPGLALAQASGTSTPSSLLDPVVVSATRTPMSSLDVPASISTVDGDSIRDGRLGVDFAESMGGVPGLVARNRQNYAQDEQVEIRGFGARSSFGLRGIRVYVDGIPSTLPDGQGWVSNLDLDSVERIEVLRGPYSALYGNSSGGVIQAFTQAGGVQPVGAAGFAVGSFGEIRESSRATGTAGGLGYNLDYTHFQTDGYRVHSAAERNTANARLDYDVDERGHLMVVVNAVDEPTAQDPLGLTRSEFNGNRRAVDPAAALYNTRKTFDQTQWGATYERRIGAEDTLSVRYYSGTRNAEQFQGIPPSSEAPPASAGAAVNPGAVINLSRQYQGVDAHFTHHVNLLGGPLTLTAGASFDGLDEQRQGHANFYGANTHPTALGVTGQLRRDQFNTVNDLDEYVQALWNFLPDWSASAGLRHSGLQFASTDNSIAFAAAGATPAFATPQHYSAASYGAMLPVVGLEFKAAPTVRVYANVARGFETPTLTELAYRPNNGPGLNFALQPDHSDNYELGVKARLDGIGLLDAAIFRIDTMNEIVTQTNTGGHAVYQNAGDTKRQGLELSWEREFAHDGRLQLAYTYLDAFYRTSYLTCIVTGCPTAANPQVTVAGGNSLPAIARQTGYAELAWRPAGGWQGGVEFRTASRMFGDDRNTQAAPGYGITSVRVGYRLPLGRLETSAFARVDNVFDQAYAGSVIVDETSLRYFEPAPGRAYLMGANVNYRF